MCVSLGLGLTADMGLTRDIGRGSFVESVTGSAQTFYGEVLQNLRGWKPAPPRLRKTAEPETRVRRQSRTL